MDSFDLNSLINEFLFDILMPIIIIRRYRAQFFGNLVHYFQDHQIAIQ